MRRFVAVPWVVGSNLVRVRVRVGVFSSRRWARASRVRERGPGGRREDGGVEFGVGGGDEMGEESKRVQDGVQAAASDVVAEMAEYESV